jgi:hypothetical protein
MKSVAVEIGAQVYLEEGGEVKGPGVRASHDGKVILDPAKLDPALLEAARHAHEHETD